MAFGSVLAWGGITCAARTQAARTVCVIANAVAAAVGKTALIGQGRRRIQQHSLCAARQKKALTRDYAQK
jgi:hypothetical protein